jgi:hypothetical protein
LLGAGGAQRTDSTHVVAAVRGINRLELARDAVSATLEALAAAEPRWVAAAFDDLLCDPGSALFAGLPILRKKTALTDYSYRLTHDHQRRFLTALDTRMVGAGLATTDEAIFDLDFHAVMHWGADPALTSDTVDEAIPCGAAAGSASPSAPGSSARLSAGSRPDYSTVVSHFRAVVAARVPPDPLGRVRAQAVQATRRADGARPYAVDPAGRRAYKEARQAEVAAITSVLDAEVTQLTSVLSATLRTASRVDWNAVLPPAAIPPFDPGPLGVAEPAPQLAAFSAGRTERARPGIRQEPAYRRGGRGASPVHRRAGVPRGT